MPHKYPTLGIYLKSQLALKIRRIFGIHMQMTVDCFEVLKNTKLTTMKGKKEKKNQKDKKENSK